MSAIDTAAAADARGWANAREHGFKASPGETSTTMIVACAALHTRDACRRAYEATTDTTKSPAQKIGDVVGACRDAYCMDLSPPPRLCREKNPGQLGPAALTPMWEELDDAILRHDLGPASARVLEARRRGKLQATAALEGYFEAGSPPYVVGSAKPESAEHAAPGVIITLAADGSATVDGTKVASDDMVDALLARRTSQREPPTKALIRPEGKVPYGRVIGMMDRAARAHLEATVSLGPNSERAP